jgi:hypothetical protein
MLGVGQDDSCFEHALTTEHRFQADEALVDPQMLFLANWKFRREAQHR